MNYDNFLDKLHEIEEESKLLRSQNEHWKKLILSCLLECYDTQKNNIQKDLAKFDGKGQIEDFIKDKMSAWLNNTRKFSRNVEMGIKLTVIQEDKTVSGIEGYHDLRFVHSAWDQDFIFECKCIGSSKNKSENPQVDMQESDLKQYVYNHSKTKPDGGVYRYLTGKYAYNSNTKQALNFGGMIGFLLKGNIERTIEKICDRLETEKYGKENYPEPTITRQSIENQPFTFNSSHQRFIAQKPDAKDILLHHLIMDFTIS